MKKMTLCNIMKGAGNGKNMLQTLLAMGYITSENVPNYKTHMVLLLNFKDHVGIYSYLFCECKKNKKKPIFVLGCNSFYKILTLTF